MAGPSLWACTHVRTRAYIRGLRSLRQSINTHDATGEAGRRVRVSQRITPPLSLHLSPFVNPASLRFSSSSSTSVIVPVVTPCLFSAKNPEEFAWQENLWPQVGVSKKWGSVNKTKRPVTPSQQAAWWSGDSELFRRAGWFRSWAIMLPIFRPYRLNSPIRLMTSMSWDVSLAMFLSQRSLMCFISSINLKGSTVPTCSLASDSRFTLCALLAFRFWALILNLQNSVGKQTWKAEFAGHLFQKR